MHFFQAVTLFAAGAAAAAVSSSPAKASSTPAKASSTPAKASSTPAKVSSTPAKVSSTPAKVSSTPAKVLSSPIVQAAAVSTPAAAQPTPPSAAQVNAIASDLNTFDKAMINAIWALGNFTGGSNINDQAVTVGQSGDAWQASVVQLLGDSNRLSGASQFSTADSSNLASIISNTIAADAVKLYQAISDKKALLVQVGARQNVHDGLVGIAQELNAIGDALGSHFQSADVPTIQAAGKKIFDSASSVIGAYSS